MEGRITQRVPPLLHINVVTIAHVANGSPAIASLIVRMQTAK
jgi:hypothetical protein